MKKLTKIARDSENKIMWISCRRDLSPLTYREFREGRDMTSGSIVKDEIRYLPPFTVKEEDLEMVLYLQEEKRLKEFNKWRKEKSKELPSLANRVFALRNKMYYGCGFHWSLEKDLGYIISVMNDFDSGYRDFAKRIVVEVRYRHFIEQIEKAESNDIDHKTMTDEILEELKEEEK